MRLALNSAEKKYYAVKIFKKSSLKKKFMSRKLSAFTLLEREIAIMKKIDEFGLKIRTILISSPSTK